MTRKGTSDLFQSCKQGARSRNIFSRQNVKTIMGDYDDFLSTQDLTVLRQSLSQRDEEASTREALNSTPRPSARPIPAAYTDLRKCQNLTLSS
jgi:hypothetical protein